MSELIKAVAALKHDIRNLEEGKLSIDKLIIEKQRQIEIFQMEIAHAEAGNSKGKPFKTA